MSDYNTVCSSLSLSLSLFLRLSYAESAIKRVPLSSWHDVGRNEEKKEIISALTDAFEVLDSDS